MAESRIYGINACQYFFKNRKKNIIRAYFSKKIVPQFGETMSYLAKSKKVYRVVEHEELQKISKSEHHEGVCFIIDRPRVRKVSEFLEEKKKLKSDVIFALENVNNPHNLGAISRVCAHFGVKTILHSDPKLMLSGASMRVAEGGAEFVEPIQVDSWSQAISELQKIGYKIVTTSSHEGDIVFKFSWPEKSVIFFGSESSGLSVDVLEKAQAKLKIPGTGSVESLNVSTAVTVIASELWRLHNS